MATELNDLEKQKLEDHYKRYLQTNSNYKRLQLQHLWEFLHHSAFFAPLCKAIKEKFSPRYHQNSYWIVWEQRVNFLYGNEEERIGLSYLVIEDIVTGNHDSGIIYRIGKQYMGKVPGSDADYFNLFNELFLDPLKSHLTLQMKRSVAVTELLGKYKHRTEWYTRNNLYQMAISESKSAERGLMSDLYGYLHDNGINVYIEPASPAGRIDFVGVQMGSPVKVLIEGKVFDGQYRSKSHLVSGFEQLRNYAKEYHEAACYLIVFNLSPKHVNFETGELKDGFPVLSIDNRLVYFIIIDLFLHDQPASTRPIAETIEISKADLIGQ